MGFTFASDHVGRSRIVVANEPDYIIPLQIAPSGLEDCLKQGKWLVASMSVWSVHDIRAGHRAIELVKRHGGLLKLGLRPFDYPQENSTWVPGIGVHRIADQVEAIVGGQDNLREVTIQGAAHTSPVWVAISEGKFTSVQTGQLTDADSEGMISQLLARN